jgi:hypothetical protein
MARNSRVIKLQRSVIVIVLVLFLYYSASGQGLIISSGAKFIAENGNIVLLGNVVNDGSLINNTNTFVFAGAAQSLGGTTPVIFNNLTIASGSTTTIIAAGQSLKGILLSNGTLNSNGNITLLSTVTQTALIDGSGTGQVTGNVTMQRYLPSGFGYKYFSSPFQGATVNEFGNEVNLLAAFPLIYKYDETRVSSGWVAYTNSAGVLNPLHGYAVNFGTSGTPITADLTGVVNNNSLSRTMYNNNNLYTKGFNLAGNPYPSPIDWNALAGWTKTNIDNSLYYFKASVTDQYTGTYSTYINGFSSDGVASNIIPSMQAFFIHVTDGTWPVTGTLAMNNNVRINNFSQQFFKSANSYSGSFLRLTAHFGDIPDSSDPMVIYFDEKAMAEFDSGLDALKLMNTDPLVPNLYAVSFDGHNLSINALPVTEDSLLVVPLGLKTARTGSIIFRIKDTGDLPAGTQIYLYDDLTKADQNLNLNKEYTVYLSAGEYINRFSIRLVKGTTGIPEIIPDTDLFSIYSSHGILKADINLVPGTRGTLIINNISGQILFRREIYAGGYQEFDPKLKSGIYLISYITGNVRDTKKIIILDK